MSAMQPSLFEDSFHPLNGWLDEHFEEVDAFTFYRELFPEGFLEREGEEVSGKYRGVAVRICQGRARRFSISDGLEVLPQALQGGSEEFWLASPVSYAGRSQKQDMARFLYAVAIDLDGVRTEQIGGIPRGLGAMWNQIDHDVQPRPTYIVSSGNGLHMYYFLDKPLALYRNVVKQLQRFRHDLVRLVWSSYVTELWKKPQYESVTQGFRMVGTCTKNGGRVRAWRTGERVDIDYLNQWVQEKNRLTDIHYQSSLTLAQAKEAYPEWYQVRIVEKRPRGSWKVDRALYDWWRDQKINEAETGHRYFYLMSLAIFATKCGITYEELEHDAWQAAIELRTKDLPGNPLTDADVIKALDMYNANYQTFPRRSIQAITGIPLPPNKRNGRKQVDHLKVARFVRDLNDETNGTDWRYHGGAPTKEEVVRAWREANPHGRKIDCERETGLSRPTVLKWW